MTIINQKVKQFFHDHTKDIEDRDFSGMIEDMIWNYKDKQKTIFNMFKNADVEISTEEIKSSMYAQGLSKSQYKIIDLYNINIKDENKLIKDLTYTTIQLNGDRYDAYEIEDNIRTSIREILQQEVDFKLNHINLSSQKIEYINFYLIDINNITYLSIDIGDCINLLATSDYITDLLYIVYDYAIAFDEDKYNKLIRRLI